MRRPDPPAGRRPAGHAAARPSRLRVGLPRLSSPLSNWPVSRRLSAVIVIAVALGVFFGALRIAAATGTATAFARTTQLAVLGEEATTLAQAMENERDLTAAVCAASPGAQCPTAGEQVDQTARSLQAGVRRAQAVTNAAARPVQALAAQIGRPFPVNTQAKAAAVVAMISHLPSLRVRGVTQPPQAVIVGYTQAIGSLFALNDEITSASGDPVLSDEVRTLGSLSRAKDEASQERGVLDAALVEGSFNDVPAALSTAQGLEDTDLSAFVSSATQAEENDYLSTVDVEKTDTGQLLTNFLFLTAVSDPRLSTAQAFAQAYGNAQFTRQGAIVPPQPDAWYSTMTDTISRMQAVEQRLAATIVARSQSLEQGARESAVLTAAATAALLVLVLFLTFILAHSLVHPLRRLRADALDIATLQLPARVAALSEATDPDETWTVEPISVRSTDEIGQVARAFDRVHAEAVRLAGNEALLRGSLSAMFINLSRRSVPLIERLARMIDSLEQHEDDPDRLSSLFSMDHLVTRMRRNSENLLVLAGEEPARKWGAPVPLTDVARAAMSEIEQYTRVLLDIPPEAAVSGQAASDVVHLLAEIMENATVFSPRDTPVHVSGHEYTNGGVLLEVRDEGLGISAPRLAEINHRLDNPPAIDVSVSRHMGLFAVSRLAARHGVKVRLRAAAPEGVSALVWLPGSLAGRHAAPWPQRRASQAAAGQLSVDGRSGPGRRRFVVLADHQEDDSTDGHLARGLMTGAAPASARSIWFRASRPSGASARAAVTSEVTDPGGTNSPGAAGSAAAAAGGGGSQAEALSAPVPGDETPAGLPSRVPGANLFSGSAVSAAPEARGPRSPQKAQSRLGGFQLGNRRAEDSMSSEGEGS